MSEDVPSAQKPSGVLRPWQRRLYGLLLIPLGLIAANAIYLFAFTRDTAFFYAMLLMHLVLGVSHRDPLLRLRADARAADDPHLEQAAKSAGLTIVTLAALCIGTGVFMTFKGRDVEEPRHLPRARARDAAGARRLHPPPARRYPQAASDAPLPVGRRRGRRSSRPWRVVHKLEKPPQRIVNRNGDTLFFPSSVRPSTRGCSTRRSSRPIDYCRVRHPDSFHQWQRSAHRFSSFNNPFYRQSVELMADRVGRERTKWCSGCHDPVVLFTGQMGAATQATFSYDSWSRRSRA